MIWIGGGSLIIIFFSIRAYLNNKYRWQTPGSSKSYSRISYLFLQGITILLILAAVLFFMLAVVGHFRGLDIHFSSEYAYHMHITDG